MNKYLAMTNSKQICLSLAFFDVRVFVLTKMLSRTLLLKVNNVKSFGNIPRTKEKNVWSMWFECDDHSKNHKICSLETCVAKGVVLYA